MAKFIIETIQKGYVNSGYTYETAISDIEFDKEDSVVVLPDTYMDKVVTHLGYAQVFIEGHEVWCDWHHPSKGSDFEPDKYDSRYTTIYIPEHVKKIVIPKTIIDIGYYAFKYQHDLKFEIDSENPKYMVKENKIVRK